MWPRRIFLKCISVDPLWFSLTARCLGCLLNVVTLTNVSSLLLTYLVRGKLLWNVAFEFSLYNKGLDKDLIYLIFTSELRKF